MGNRRRRGPAACLLLWFLMGFDLCCASLNHEGLALLRLREMVEADPSGALAGWDEADASPCFWFGVECSDDGRVVGLLVLGYAYPAYDCYKTVELNRPEIEQLRFWCQYWILLAMLTVFERVGDNFISWLPMYSEAKHESEIDRNLLELRTRASDMAVVYFHKVADYSQTRFHEILQYIASQSQAQRSRSQEMPRCYVVYVGQVPGVYEEWKDCQKQVNNFSGNSYQGYESREVAEEKWRRHGRKRWRNFLVITTLLLFIVGYVFYFI